MSGTLNTSGLLRLEARLRSLAHLDFQPLMRVWEDILDTDNRAGALAGIDGYDRPLKPVKYRPDENAAHRPVVFTLLKNNNLTTSHYKTLDGPPLAPRREQSRVVTNFVTAHGRDGTTAGTWTLGSPSPGKGWFAIAGWEDVLSTKDVPFLGFHFRGEGRLPVRDLAHVRPTTRAKARDALRQSCAAALRSNGGTP